MNASLFQVELVGGPEDGHFTEVGTFPGRMVFLPSRPMAMSQDEPAGNASPAGHVALYELAHGQYSCDVSGFPIITLRYEFAELGSPGGRTKASAIRRRTERRAVSSNTSRWLRRLSQRLAAWMLAPIDYPMKISPVTANAAIREASAETSGC